MAALPRDRPFLSAYGIFEQLAKRPNPAHVLLSKKAFRTTEALAACLYFAGNPAVYLQFRQKRLVAFSPFPEASTTYDAWIKLAALLPSQPPKFLT